MDSIEETIKETDMNSLEDLYKSTSEYFKENKYLVLKGFVDQNMAGLLYQYCLVKVQQMDFKSMFAKEAYNPEWDGKFGDEQAPISYNCYGDAMMETILAASTRTLSNYVGFELTPNYSYWRLYQQGEVLLRHRDRESCEVSATLCLGYNTANLDAKEHPDYNWPMFVETKDDPDGVPIHLTPGDLIIYRGCEVEHWRERFLGMNHAQVFLHYNDPTGPFGIRLDGRPILAVPKQYQQ
jgi:hypothetical protein